MEFFQRTILSGPQVTAWGEQVYLPVPNVMSLAKLTWLAQNAPALSCTPAEGGTEWVAASPMVSRHKDGMF